MVIMCIPPRLPCRGAESEKKGLLVMDVFLSALDAYIKCLSFSLIQSSALNIDRFIAAQKKTLYECFQTMTITSARAST